LEEIKSDPRLYGTKQVPVIITSNLGQESDMAKGRELGVVDYFVKAQVSIEDIVSKVKNVLQTKV